MKTGFLITARLKSTRLPLKLLKDLNGRMVIERIVDRAKALMGIDAVILCTSYHPQDKLLVDIARKNDIYYFTGHTEDVLARLKDAAVFFGVDFFLSITGDNPLFSMEYASLVLDAMTKDAIDYICVSGLPLGTAVAGVRTKALTTVCEAKCVSDTEIWGPWLDIPDIFNVEKIVATNRFNRPDLRLTLDYEEDYLVLNHLYAHIPFKKVLNLSNVLDYLAEHPHIGEINCHCFQKKIDDEIMKVIRDEYTKRLRQLSRS